MCWNNSHNTMNYFYMWTISNNTAKWCVSDYNDGIMRSGKQTHFKAQYI